MPVFYGLSFKFSLYLYPPSIHPYIILAKPPPYRCFYVTNATRALQSHGLSGEGISLTLDHIDAFLTTQGHGEPPRMRDQLNAGATSETTWT